MRSLIALVVAVPLLVVLLPSQAFSLRWQKGERIGAVGSSGRATGAHLDWRVNLFTARLDPALLVTIQPVGSPPVTSATQLIPLPVASALAGYQISPRWSFMARLDVFALEYKDFKGSMTDIRLVLEHHTFKNVGFGFGLNRFDFNVEASNDDILGEIDNTYNGFLIYVTTYTGKTAAGSQFHNKNR